MVKYTPRKNKKNTKNKIKPHQEGVEKSTPTDGVVEKYEKISKNKTYKK